MVRVSIMTRAEEKKLKLPGSGGKCCYPRTQEAGGGGAPAGGQSGVHSETLSQEIHFSLFQIGLKEQ